MTSFANRRALLLATPIALVAALVTALVVVSVGDDEPSSTDGSLDLETAPPRVDDLAAVALLTLDGDETTLADELDGRPTVINFFGSWCGPCIRELPDLQSVHEQAGDAVAFIGLAVADRRDDAADILDTSGVDYPAFDDNDGLAYTFFGGIKMPTTMFLDADGEVVARKDGAITGAALRAQLADLFDIDLEG